jgi:hypothetical protein
MKILSFIGVPDIAISRPFVESFPAFKTFVTPDAADTGTLKLHYEYYVRNGTINI